MSTVTQMPVPSKEAAVTATMFWGVNNKATGQDAVSQGGHERNEMSPKGTLVTIGWAAGSWEAPEPDFWDSAKNNAEGLYSNLGNHSAKTVPHRPWPRPDCGGQVRGYTASWGQGQPVPLGGRPQALLLCRG